MLLSGPSSRESALLMGSGVGVRVVRGKREAQNPGKVSLGVNGEPLHEECRHAALGLMTSAERKEQTDRAPRKPLSAHCGNVRDSLNFYQVFLDTLGGHHCLSRIFQFQETTVMKIRSMSKHRIGKQHWSSAKDWFLEESANLDKRYQRRHELRILSCYVDLKALQSFVGELSEVVRLTDVYLAFDYSEVYRYGPHRLKKDLGAIRQSCTKKGIKIDFRFLANPSGLVHAKGYALLQRVDGDIAGGALLLGSANLTAPGFMEGGNVELGAMTRQLAQLRSFEVIFDALWEGLGRDAIDDAVFARDKNLFNFALLSSGVFLHKWEGSLRQLVGIRYKIVNEEKWSQLPDDLQAEGFELSKTLTRQVLDLDDLPKRSLPGEFVRNFTIDTALGRWCPESAWAEVAGSESDAFWAAFKAASTDEILEDKMRLAAARQEQLIREGFIATVDGEHLESWARRIRTLRDSQERLARLHTGYEAFPMPYDAQSTSEIEDLYESFELSLETRTYSNWVIRAVQACIAGKTLAPLKLDEEAKALLQLDC